MAESRAAVQRKGRVTASRAAMSMRSAKRKRLYIEGIRNRLVDVQPSGGALDSKERASGLSRHTK